MLQYKKLAVNYNRPYIWRQSIYKEIPKKQKTYLEVKDEEKKFLEYKENVKKSLINTFSLNIDKSDEINILSKRMADLFDGFGRSMIFDTGIDPIHLLKHTNKITLNKKLQGWCRQLNGNIPTITKSGYGVVGLLEKFKNVPAFVIAAGPSLKNNIQELKKVGNKGLIVATDTAFRPLLEAGIEPHFVMAHDANHNGAKFFLPKNYFPEGIGLNDANDNTLHLLLNRLRTDKPKLLDTWHYNTVGVFVNYVSPLTIESFCGDTVCYYAVMDPSLPIYMTMAMATNYKQNKDGSFVAHDKGAIVGGSSVGHTAFYLANALGCNPISYLGLDLSYPEGKAYIEGASNNKDVSKIKLVEVEDLSGHKVNTNMSMFSYRTVLEKMLPQIIMARNLTVYNCTEHADGTPAGILRLGAEPKRLSWVIDAYCKTERQEIDNIKKMIREDRNKV